MATKDKRANRKQRREQKRQNKKIRQWAIIGAVVLIALLAVGYTLRPKPQAPEVSQARLDDNPMRGGVGAQVTITEFGDFGCPACKSWHEAGVLNQILDQYGDRVLIVWRDLPIITAQSPKAAEAAQCAYDQDRFWDYHDILFDRAPRLAVGQLKDYAQEIGLDTVAFEACLDSGQHEDTVEKDLRAAFQLGLRGTPSFLVNDQPLIGANPQTMIQMIEFHLGQ